MILNHVLVPLSCKKGEKTHRNSHSQNPQSQTQPKVERKDSFRKNIQRLIYL